MTTSAISNGPLRITKVMTIAMPFPLPGGGAFRPKTPAPTEHEALSSISTGHSAMTTVLANRHRNLQIIRALWSGGDVKTAVDSAVSMQVVFKRSFCLKKNKEFLSFSVFALVFHDRGNFLLPFYVMKFLLNLHLTKE